MLELFPFIRNLYLKTIPVTDRDGQPDISSLYIVNRYLSFNSAGFFTAVKSNRLSAKIPQWAGACFIYHNIPKKSKPPYIDYLKKEKESTRKEVERIISRLEEFLCCNYKHAKQTYELLEKEGVDVKALFGGYKA